ncbi:GlsB/YeaQ/YmgE family stress response membrane protein [Acuticoccus sp. MNP-M23]|uniref:GlsB/YeaQ/YmgE family stress response membrane protein n=1 Tax=Acuticoccus sp. MNP-M23 TaxID=3072793 RepID=UPI0028152267|nr:GlsB/YeaQ/YmgE family stress response membrane protein [Acuticoccus sp. MNP-M23]WMS41713.1 GlsB/YeaQ/YmgE family stress response membrane protein [Acuticoccus sp. MNP-M23]
MDLNGVGWLTAIIVGALAGWIAEKLMKSDMGLFANIILGIIGAAALNFVLALLDIQIGYGWIAFLIAGVIGACALIGITRAVRGR